MLELLLHDLSPLLFTFLVISAGFTSFVTASLGAGGGVILLGVMAQVLPPLAIIPLHGVAQLGSNGGRAIMSWRHIDWQLIARFFPGTVLGALIGHFVLVALPPGLMYLSIALFILYLCWGPKLPKMILGPIGTFLAGTVTSFLSLFVGATGPLVGAFIKQVHIDRFTTVATFAAAMSVQHLGKIAVFENAGFDLLPWMPLLISMISAGAIGTWIGLRLLKRMKDHHFQNLFNWILTLLALRLIWQSVTA